MSHLPIQDHDDAPDHTTRSTPAARQYPHLHKVHDIKTHSRDTIAVWKLKKPPG
jgi:hypothetical protein